MDYFSAGETFPAQDGVASVAPSDVPAHYDLTEFLSDSFKARPPWRDLAAATSRVLYEYVEKQRVLLGEQRDPRGIARALKIATLKMMGLDWNSDVLTDADYDRMVESVALYNANHGTEDFINFMGYSLGLPLSAVEQWTRDYVTFGPGPQSPSIFDSPPGPWYPTTHVGVLYEQYAANASDADVAVITDIFYRVAPINLVLAWVGTLVTLEVGPLMHEEKLFESSTDTVICQYDPLVILDVEHAVFDYSTDTALCEPLYPARTVSLYAELTSAVESYVEGSVARPTGILWNHGSPIPVGMQSQQGYDVVYADGSSLLYWYPGNDGYVSPDGASRGLVCQPDVVLLQSASGQPQMSNWAQLGVSTSPTFTQPDGTQGFTVSTTAAGGCVVGGATPLGTDCIALTFRLPSSGAVSLARGSDFLTLTISDLHLSSSGLANAGIFPLGSTGIYVLWGIMTGTQIAVFPGGIGGSGSIDWIDCQVLQGANFPVPTPHTVPTPDAYVQDSSGLYSAGYFGSSIDAVSTLLSGGGGSFGTSTGVGIYGVGGIGTTINSNEDMDAASFSSDFYGGDADYYFQGGEILREQIIRLLTASSPTALAGTQTSLPGALIVRSFGVMRVRARQLRPSSSLQTLISIVNSNFSQLVVQLSGTTLTLLVGQRSASMTADSEVVDVGIKWGAASVEMFYGGLSVVIDYPPAAISGATPWVMSPTGLSCPGWWVLENVLFIQSGDDSLLPTAAYMAAVTATETGG